MTTSLAGIFSHHGRSSLCHVSPRAIHGSLTGNIVDYFYEMDATSAFESFHGHSAGAQKYLKALPVLKDQAAAAAASVPKEQGEHAAAMSKMIASWKAKGLFEPKPLATGLYGAAVVAAIVLSVVLAPSMPVVRNPQSFKSTLVLSVSPAEKRAA